MLSEVETSQPYSLSAAVVILRLYRKIQKKVAIWFDWILPLRFAQCQNDENGRVTIFWASNASGETANFSPSGVPDIGGGASAN